MTRRWNNKQLIEAVKVSKTYTEICKKLNLKVSAGNFYTIKKYIKMLNLKIDHFESASIRKKALSQSVIRRTSTKEELLIENCLKARKQLIVYLKRNNTLPYICSICQQYPLWNSKPLVLQLDHINGIGNDNRIENIRWLCPNCHTQTPTWSGRNKK